MPTTQLSKKTITLGQLVTFAFALIAALGTMSVLHAQYVIPSIMERVDKLIDKEQQESATREYVDIVFSVHKEQLDRIERKVDNLSKQ